jgi:CDP-diacylglycerol--glycerol-3-phosphate 3-phosphatidyltransferase
VLSDAALYLPLALLPGVNPLWIMLAVLLGIVAEMTGVIAVQIGAVRRYDGPMGKSDRAFVFGLLCLLLGLELVPPRWFNYAMNATVVLLVLTIINRARRALAESAG